MAVHTGPVVGLEDAFLSFGDTTVTGEEAAVGLVDDRGY